MRDARLEVRAVNRYEQLAAPSEELRAGFSAGDQMSEIKLRGMMRIGKIRQGLGEAWIPQLCTRPPLTA